VSGVFPTWQPPYAERGIATFPIDETKKPRVKGWQRVGLRGSTELAAKFKDADALGFVTGRRSNVTIVDVDTTDEKITEDAIARHGQPTIITRTASGKHHLLYRYNGERRRIRPWPELPIDVLGDNGFAIAAPSKLAGGSYEIVHGHLDDIGSLKPIAAIDLVASLPPRWIGMREGDGRNRALWERCMRTGGGCNLDLMMEIARNANQQFEEPMMDAEVVKVATSAWQHDAAGLNFFARPRVMLDHDIVDALGNSDAVALLVRLERYHGGNDRFFLANEMAASLGWGLARWRAARDCLVSAQVIERLKTGGRGPHDPPLYGWTRNLRCYFGTPI
jgi:hypothetical protein